MAAPTPPSLLPLPLSPLPSTGTTNDESALTYLKAYLATSLPFYLEEFILLDEIVEPGPTFHKFPYLPAELRKSQQVNCFPRRDRTPWSALRPFQLLEDAETLANPSILLFYRRRSLPLLL